MFFLSFLALGGLTGALLYDFLRINMEQIQNITRTRGQELTTTLGALAEEGLEGANRARISALMKKVVKASNFKGDFFEVHEIVLVDVLGKGIAGSDVLSVADKEQKKFQTIDFELDEERFKDVLLLTADNPIKFDVLETIKPGSIQTPLIKYFREYLPGFDPGILAEKFHLGRAIYLAGDKTITDLEKPAARLHLIISSRNAKEAIKRFEPVMERAFLAALIVWGGLNLSALILILLPIFRAPSNEGAVPIPVAAPVAASGGGDEEVYSEYENHPDEEFLDESRMTPPGIQMYEPVQGAEDLSRLTEHSVALAEQNAIKNLEEQMYAHPEEINFSEGEELLPHSHSAPSGSEPVVSGASDPGRILDAIPLDEK